MNERIRELFEQAGLKHYGEDYFAKMDKFAELIVRECIDTAFHHGHPDLEFLLEHFGVKE